MTTEAIAKPESREPGSRNEEGFYLENLPSRLANPARRAAFLAAVQEANLNTR
jgi:hypothetical protein